MGGMDQLQMQFVAKKMGIFCPAAVQSPQELGSPASRSFTSWCKGRWTEGDMSPWGGNQPEVEGGSGHAS